MWVNNLPNFSASARRIYCPEELLQQKNPQPKTNLTEEFKYKKSIRIRCYNLQSPDSFYFLPFLYLFFSHRPTLYTINLLLA